MATLNEMIISNIIQAMSKAGKKQGELAEEIHVSKQTMSKMLSGDRMIQAVELAAIAEALHVSVDALVKSPLQPQETDAIRAFMGEVKTDEARNALALADQLADLICFHSKCRENGEKLTVSW